MRNWHPEKWPGAGGTFIANLTMEQLQWAHYSSAYLAAPLRNPYLMVNNDKLLMRFKSAMLMPTGKRELSSTSDVDAGLGNALYRHWKTLN